MVTQIIDKETMRMLNLAIDFKKLQHELRTPLTGILGMAMLLSEEKLTSQQRKKIETILRCSNDLLNFINFLTYKLKKEAPQPYLDDSIGLFFDLEQPSGNNN